VPPSFFFEPGGAISFCLMRTCFGAGAERGECPLGGGKGVAHSVEISTIRKVNAHHFSNF